MIGRSTAKHTSLMTKLYSVKRALRPPGFVLAFTLLCCAASAQTAPHYAWHKHINGGDGEQEKAVGTDGHFNVVAAGNFGSSYDFDPGPGVAMLTAAPSVLDIYVVKYRSNGDFAWAKDFDNHAYSTANAIAGDVNGGVVVAGEFVDTVDFNPGPAVNNLVAASNASDGFLCKLDSSGNYVWAFSISSTGQEYIRNMTVDSVGNIYCVGNFQNTVDFDPGPGVSTLMPTFTAEGTFVAKYSPAGALLWVKQIENQPGGSGIGFSVRVMYNGDLLIGGEFWGPVDFDPGAGTHIETANGFNSDCYLLKLDATNGTYITDVVFGSSSDEFINDITSDENGNMYACGSFNGTCDLAPGVQVASHVSNGNYDVFLVAISSSGTYLWSQTWGNSFNSSETRLAYAPSSGLHMTGYFVGTVDFDPGPGTQTLSGASPSETFYVRYSASGNFLFAAKLGDAIPDVHTDKFDAVYFAGSFNGTTNFDPFTGTAFASSTPSFDDAFTVKLCAANQTNLNFSYCPGDSVLVNGNWFDHDSAWTNTYVSRNGCDSIVNVNVSMFTPFVLFQPLSQDTFCVAAGDFMLNTGFPSGGTYSGPGVTDSTFHPASAGIGTHDLIYTFTYPNGCTGQDTLSVVVENCLNVSTTTNAPLAIYPQPAHDYLFLDFPGTMDADEVTLYSLQGQSLPVQQSRTGQQQLQLDLRGLAPGVYFLRAAHEGTLVTYRIVKQ